MAWAEKADLDNLKGRGAKLAADLQRNRGWTGMANVWAAMLEEWRRIYLRRAGAAPTPAHLMPTPARPPIADATYTVALADGTHATVKIETMPANSSFAPGRRIASYLAGPDNETSFAGFAFIDGDTLRVWSRYQNSERAARYADATRLILGQPTKSAESREAYALLSSRCARCNRTLTVPASIHRGLGPECAQKMDA